ncbi:MAG: hypothetical protein GX430_14905 [Treponema sp.]|nr:hypothetical protein [Treponema sp.]
MNLNPYLLAALVVLGVAATAQYFFGRRRNRALAASISKGLETLLKPNHTNYVNIGGSIGYNFVYTLSTGPWVSAKGTMTMSPRQSLLYLPISRLLGFTDRFFINLFTKKKIKGEAHIVARATLRRARIDGIEEMSRRDTEAGGKSFVLLWRGTDLSAELESLLAAFPEPRRLRHFCSYPGNKTFYLYVVPKGGDVSADLETVLHAVPKFLDSKKED